MKIIHCADLHIDCKNYSKFSPEKRRQKQYQHLQNFVDMVAYAEKQKVTAILLCGDVFDSPKVLKKSLKVVQDTILAHPNITFFYVWGNHDEGVKIFDKNPSNFVAFGTKFSKVDFGDVCIGGMSYQRQVEKIDFENIDFDAKDFNILMMHGPVLEGDKYSAPIPIKKLVNKNVDFLALGHIHQRNCGTLGKRCSWSFAGSVEGCKFSNSGDNYGFDLIEIENKKMSKVFVPFAKYKFQIVEIDVTKIRTNEVLCQKIVEKTAKFSQNDIVKIVFTGNRKEENELNFGLAKTRFEKEFFYLEFDDQTKVIFDLDKYASEKLSLKAEFIKEVMADKSLSEEEKQQICLVGLEVLKGEEISL